MVDVKTVGDLKKILEKYPDNLVIEGYDDYYSTDGVNIWVNLEWDDLNSKQPKDWRPHLTISCPDYARIHDRNW